nr:radical SAM protein [uncultured Dethiosulfovibrio sp.]
MSGKRFAVFLSMKGCKGRCVYCDQKAITGENPPSPEEIKNAIDSSNIDFEEICFFGGSFTCLPTKNQRDYLQISKDLSIPARMSTHPMCIDQGILDVLSEFPITMIELGISSLDDETLALCRRGYTGEDGLRAIELIMRNNYDVCAQLMIGLPGQTMESSLMDIKRLAELKGPRDMTLRIYPCLVLENTELYRMMGDGYEPLKIEDAVTWGGELLFNAEKMGFKVQRIGLSETPSLAKAVAGGPHHPALGEMIRGYGMAKKLSSISKEGPWFLPANRISLLTGHGGIGLKAMAKIVGLPIEETKKRIFVRTSMVD